MTDSLQQRAEAAKLVREDGSRRYSDNEHAERESALKADLGGALDAVEATADEEISRAEATLAKYFDRSALLGVRYTIRKYTHPHGYGGCIVAGAGYRACGRRNRSLKRLALRMDQEPGADASGRTRLRSSVRNCSG